jgi:collagenase-like PrtC family protease
MDRQWEGLSWACRRTLVDKVAAHAVDAIGLSDQALMFYTAANYPQLQLHYIAENIVDALSAERLKRQLNVSRVALPQLLSMTELIRISRDTTAELQLYGFCRFSSVIDAAKLQAAAMENRATKTESRQPDGEGFSDQCATPECAANDGCFNDHCAADIKVLRLLPQLNALGIRAIRIDAAGSRPIHTAARRSPRPSRP